MSDVDERGYPGTHQSDGSFDGGDTAAIIGNMITLGQAEIFPMKLRLMRAMLIRPGWGLVRHPDPTKWYGKPDRFSRDQLIPILCSFVGEIPTAEVRTVFSMHKKNKFLWAWNTRKNGVMDAPLKTPDFTGPEIWALWYRVRSGPWWLRILLPILDLETLVGSIIWRWRTLNEYHKPVQYKENRVCRNHMLICLTGLKKNTTWIMRLAVWLNDWRDLIDRHRAHCQAVGEYQTAELFELEAKRQQLF